jgi:arabinofuranosyltransferase
VFLILAMPALWMLWSAWTARWVTDDGFINVRVVQQILDGNGPVFNAGERVEASSSVLWVVSLVLGKLIFFWVPVEWIAVLLGCALTATAVALAIASATYAYRTWRLVPLGAIAYVVLPPAATFATAGLETGLTLAWIAGWYLLLLRVAESADRRGGLLAAFVLGLGPLVRPDLVIMSAAGIVALLVVYDRLHGVRRFAALAAAAIALPSTYELFRMCYYGNLLPNTAYAKEAIEQNWLQGWEYLKDFNRPYWLWVPALVAPLAFAATCGRVQGRRARLVYGTPTVAGLLYGMLVIRGGGDFMHARMLLPAVFALLLPIAAVPLQRSTVALLATILLWTAVPLAAEGPPYRGIGPHGITNERDIYVGTHGNPVTIDDFSYTGSVLFGRKARDQSESGGHRDIAIFTPFFWGRQSMGADVPAFVQGGVFGCCTIGMLSVAAGNDIYIADMCGLASPIGSRLEVSRRSRPGHEKILRASWIFAMFGDPHTEPTAGGAGKASAAPEEIEAARQALDCPAIQRMLARARAPLTPDRAMRNLIESFTDFASRIDPVPAKELARCRGTTTSAVKRPLST